MAAGIFPLFFACRTFPNGVEGMPMVPTGAGPKVGWLWLPVAFRAGYFDGCHELMIFEKQRKDRAISRKQVETAKAMNLYGWTMRPDVHNDRPPFRLGLNLFVLLQLLFVHGLHNLFSTDDRRLGEFFAFAQLLDDLRLLEFALEAFQSLVNGFAVFYIND